MQLIKASDGPLKGYTSVPVDIDQLATFKHQAYVAGVKYGYGAKDPHVGSGIIDFDDIDCSGWLRTLSDWITHNILRSAGFPDGSYQQALWLVNQGFKYHKITSAQDFETYTNVNDNLYRMLFHYPNGRGGDNVGHALAEVHQHSVESFGGHGPGERPINHQWFVDHVDLVVVIGPMIANKDWNVKTLNPYV